MEVGLPAGAGGAEPGGCSANSAIIKARVFTEVTHSVHYIFCALIWSLLPFWIYFNDKNHSFLLGYTG